MAQRSHHDCEHLKSKKKKTANLQQHMEWEEKRIHWREKRQSQRRLPVTVMWSRILGGQMRSINQPSSTLTLHVKGAVVHGGRHGVGHGRLPHAGQALVCVAHGSLREAVTWGGPGGSLQLVSIHLRLGQRQGLALGLVTTGNIGHLWVEGCSGTADRGPHPCWSLQKEVRCWVVVLH